MPTQDVTALLHAAVMALRSGDHTAARTTLDQALKLDPTNEQAWLWMSGAVETPTEQRECLEVVLKLNPANQAAQRGLQILGPPPAAPPAEEPPPAPWSAPELLPAEVVAGMPAACHHCGAQVYGNAAFCWRCHSPVHACVNCVFAAVPECKAAQQITNLITRNQCPWWRPEG